jgi:hypothetical protein
MVVRLGKILDSLLDEGESQIQASMALTVAVPRLGFDSCHCRMKGNIAMVQSKSIDQCSLQLWHKLFEIQGHNG